MMSKGVCMYKQFGLVGFVMVDVIHTALNVDDDNLY